MTALGELLAGLNLDLFERRGHRRQREPAECLLLMHIHVLPSLVPLVQRLIALGFVPDRIVVLGKPYSTIPSAASQLATLGVTVLNQWPELTPGNYDSSAGKALDAACRIARNIIEGMSLKRALIVDDGGMLTEAWFWTRQDSSVEVVSTYQTSSGFYRWRKSVHSPFAKVNVAGSAAKKYFESVIIADGVVRAALEHTKLASINSVGVIGIGWLGRQLARRLSWSKEVRVFDAHSGAADSVRLMTSSSSRELIANSELIFGCTGRNSVLVEDIVGVQDEKLFVSCSSRDIEFGALIKNIRLVRDASNIPYGDLVISPYGTGTQRISNGGFPINFDRQHEWETQSEISITRALVLLAIIQSLFVESNTMIDDDLIYQLDAESQMNIVLKWMPMIDKHPTLFGTQCGIDTVAWWRDHSTGAVALN